MARVSYRLLTLVAVLQLALGVACMLEGGVEVRTTREIKDGQSSDGSQTNEVNLSSNSTGLQPTGVNVFPVFEVVFLLFNLLFLGNAIHDWVGPKPPKPPPKGEEPYMVTFEIGSDDRRGRLDGAGGQQPNIHIYDDKAQEIGSNNDTTYLYENAMLQAAVKPNENMGGKTPKYLTLMARGNNPICLASVVVATPPPDGRPYGIAAITPMSCGLKWANSGRQNYHNLTAISYKPCFWFGNPFPEYLQVDLEFHTNDQSRQPFIDQLNKTGNEELIHEKFCNTLKHFHVQETWPSEPFDEAIITDDTVLGDNPYPLTQTQIEANMVNKTEPWPWHSGALPHSSSRNMN